MPPLNSMFRIMMEGFSPKDILWMLEKESLISVLPSEDKGCIRLGFKVVEEIGNIHFLSDQEPLNIKPIKIV